jgi:hypothetical protein
MSRYILSVARIDPTRLVSKETGVPLNMLVLAGFALYPASGRP